MGTILVSILVLMGTAFGADCDKSIKKVLMPLSFDTEQGMCFDDYFSQRNLTKISINDDGQMFPDTNNMAFDDWLLFAYEKPMGESGRLQIVKEIYQSYRSSLKNEFGFCDIQLWSADKQLQVEDFQIVQREEAGQPGTRITIQSENVVDPSWKLVCTSPFDESKKVVKQGKYFFIFVDVYENIGTAAGLDNHLSKYLFSHRQ